MVVKNSHNARPMPHGATCCPTDLARGLFTRHTSIPGQELAITRNRLPHNAMHNRPALQRLTDKFSTGLFWSMYLNKSVSIGL